jgi:release factor glutamine methyltransferase
MQQGTGRLRAAGVATAALDARVLLGYVTSYGTEELLLKRNEALPSSTTKRFLKLIERRAKHEPVAYIVEHKEFYGIDFKVNKNVLIPRPDSEALIELAQSYFKLGSDKVLRHSSLRGAQRRGNPSQASSNDPNAFSNVPTQPCHFLESAGVGLPRFARNDEGGGRRERISILDLGTGSGCLILTLLSVFPSAKGIGVDISSKALSVAKQNAVLLNLSKRIRFVKSDWSGLCLKDKFDLVISNPPYIKHKAIESLQENVKDYEPLTALDGGEDGLDCYRSIIANLRGYMKEDGVCIFELGAGQFRSVVALAKRYGFRLDRWKKDLAGKIRAVSLRFDTRGSSIKSEDDIGGERERWIAAKLRSSQ